MYEQIKILLAEDSTKFEHKFIRSLPSGLFEVVTVDNFLQLMNIYSGFSPDFLVAKSKLQYASASSVIRNIRQKIGDKDIKIFINAYEEDPELREDLEHFGIDHYFDDPDPVATTAKILHSVATSRPFNGPYKLLIIDSDTKLWEIYSKILNRKCYKLMFADNGICGLEAYNDFSPDIMLLNTTLPEIPGIEVLRKIRHDHQDQETTIIATSSTKDTSSVSLCSGLGVQGFLLKPFEYKLMSNTILLYRQIHEQTGPYEEAGDLNLDI